MLHLILHCIFHFKDELNKLDTTHVEEPEAILLDRDAVSDETIQDEETIQDGSDNEVSCTQVNKKAVYHF